MKFLPKSATTCDLIIYAIKRRNSPFAHFNWVNTNKISVVEISLAINVHCLNQKLMRIVHSESRQTGD